MIKYKIALINVFWSQNEVNTRYFINQNEQNIYFDNLASGKTSPLVNYNMGNNIETTIVYKDTTTRRVDEIVKSNYAIVYTINVENEVEQIVNRRYFFAYPRQDSGRQMIVDLVLDDVQTNYIPYQNLFQHSVFIKRAHLDRFVKDGDNFTFNLGTPDSPFYQIEDFPECPKRLVNRTPLDIHPDLSSPTSELNTFFDGNIIGWEYVYLTPDLGGGNQYKSYTMIQGAEKNITLKPIRTFSYNTDTGTGYNASGSFTNGNSIEGALICICAPVYRKNSQYGNNNVIKARSNIGGVTVDVSITNYGLESFISLNGGNSRVFARKFSIRPPFDYRTYSNATYNSSQNSLYLSDFELNDPSDITHGEYIKWNNINVMYTGDLPEVTSGGVINHRQGCIFLNVDYVTPSYTESIDLNKKVTFTQNEIMMSSKDDYYLNPKLLSNKFYELNITNFSQSYTYDFQKINDPHIRFIYSEAFTPDLTKGYARLVGDNGLYIEDCERNLTGLVISNDYSLMVANDKLAEMLANNKNFYMQQALNIAQKTIFGGLGGGMSGGEAGAIAGVTSGLLDIPKTMMNIDNLKSAPNQVNNANGSVYFATKIQPFKLTLEEYEALDFDKKAFNDYCYMFGYKYNRMGVLVSFVNIRTIFNYIEADLINVPISISNEEKRRLMNKFNTGIRFWNRENYVTFRDANYEWSVIREDE